MMNLCCIRNRPRCFAAGIALVFLTLAAANTTAAPADGSRIVEGGQPVTRHFAHSGALQLHYRQAGPGAGEQKAGRPVIALHQSPNSSQVYVEFLSVLGQDRQVIAPDTPGFGESDVPGTQPDIEDYVRILDGFADTLGLGEVDLIGYHTGGVIAVEWALRNPRRIKNLMLVGVPAFNAEERAEMRANPWPAPGPISAEYLRKEWEGSKSWQGNGQSDRSVEQTFLAKIGAGRTGWWGPDAVFRYPLLEKLVLVKQPITIVRPRDDLWDITLRAAKARPDAPLVDLPEYVFAVFEAAPERMATLARKAFDSGSQDQ